MLKPLVEDGLKGLREHEQTVEDEKCMAIRCELNRCKTILEEYKKKYSELTIDFDRYRTETASIDDDLQAVRRENLALKGQIEAYRFCIENLKR